MASGIYYERHTPRHDAVQMNAHDAMHRLALDLDLDAAQQQAISEIFARHQKDLDATWHALQPHVRATLDSTHEEILKVLRPEQAEKFRKLVEAMHPAGHR
jgi:TRAP-type C4-dicarboxylate transport system substrate-binding protein